MNAESEALIRAERALEAERQRHEATKRELHETRQALYTLSARAILKKMKTEQQELESLRGEIRRLKGKPPVAEISPRRSSNPEVESIMKLMRQTYS